MDIILRSIIPHMPNKTQIYSTSYIPQQIIQKYMEKKYKIMYCNNVKKWAILPHLHACFLEHACMSELWLKSNFCGIRNAKESTS